MVEVTTNSAYDVKVESVLIETERLAKSYDVVRNISEINIYEHLDLPYLTGTILLIDSSNIFNLINFQGTERVTLKLKMNGDDRSKTVTKRFVVTEILGAAPSGDTSETLTLSIIEDIAYQSRLMTLSKAYRGKPEIIIAALLQDSLQKKVDVPRGFQGTIVPPMKVVIPAMQPLDAARWMKNRLVSENGMPFFLYSTLNAPNLFLTDLEYLLNEPVMNANRAYTFGQAFTRATTGLSVDQQARVIESYRLTHSENMFRMARDGVLNSTYYFVDTIKDKDSRDASVKINMAETLEMMVKKGIIPRDQAEPIYDKEFKIGDKKIEEYTPSVITQISTSGSYQNFANYYESEDINQQKLKAQARAIRYYMLKSPIEIIMPGFDYLGRGPNITIGRQIRCDFLKNDPNILHSRDYPLDKKRSGNYIIYACRHIIQPQQYKVSLTCVKLGNKK